MRFQRIDELTLGDHFYLSEDDECHYLREHISRGGYRASDTNQLIKNFKKEPSLRSRPVEWRHKGRAINQIVSELRDAIDESLFDQWTFVPMPPSKNRDNPEYDDRLIQVVSRVFDEYDWRELLECKESKVASHATDDRPPPEELYRNFRIIETQAEPPPTRVALVDDVLTTGAHFVAARRRLRRRFPDLRVVGLFVARVKRPDPFENFSL